MQRKQSQSQSLQAIDSRRSKFAAANAASCVHVPAVSVGEVGEERKWLRAAETVIP